jgi:hypothetical protein
LLQTCMCRISCDSTFLDFKTFGAVIKFCSNTAVLVAKNKMLIGDCF